MNRPTSATPSCRDRHELWRAESAEGAAGWRFVADGVMGGLSSGRLAGRCPEGRRAACLEGMVRLENNGGFIQINRDLPPARRDVSAFDGLLLEVTGNDEEYGLHLKTGDVSAPWQSYRAPFTAGPEWREVALPFALFAPHRLAAPLDLTDLRRIAVVAIGRPFEAEVCVAAVSLYRR